MRSSFCKNMFFVLENEFADGELWRLRELLDLIDIKLTDITNKVSNSVDPESDGLCDRGEYFIGVGFVAIQQYLAETIMFTGISKRDALMLGPKHESGRALIDVINSCANWWKHEPEWCDKNEIPRNGEYTWDSVKSFTKSLDYPLSIALAMLCRNRNMIFLNLIPILEEWRISVHEARCK